MPEIPDDIFATPLSELAPSLRSGKISPVTLTELALARLEKFGPKFNAVVTVMRESALKEAACCEAEIKAGNYRGPLHGIPYGVKDLLATKGIPTTWGAAPYRKQVFDYDAESVVRLREAGAILCAKLAMVELAGGMGYRSADASFTGPGLCPWNPEHWSGGSSTGPAIAVAAGLVSFAIGSETSGSIITPGAYCGVTCLRPTYGRITRHGAMALCWTLDKLGPMCRSAADAAAVFDVIAGQDVNDPTSLPVAVPGYLEALAGGVWGARDLRIGLDWEYVSAEVDPEIVGSIKAALDVFVELGARIVPIKLPDMAEVVQSQRIIMETECARYHEAHYKAHPEGFGKLGDVIERGFTYRSVDVAAAYIIKDRFRGQLSEVFESVDVIPAPIMPWVGMKYDELDKLFERIPLFGRFGGICNMAGVPTITFPVGVNPIGLPLAMQLIGPHLSEVNLFKAAHAYQQATEWHLRRPAF